MMIWSEHIRGKTIVCPILLAYFLSWNGWVREGVQQIFLNIEIELTWKFRFSSLNIGKNNKYYNFTLCG